MFIHIFGDGLNMWVFVDYGQINGSWVTLIFMIFGLVLIMVMIWPHGVSENVQENNKSHVNSVLN